MDIFIGVSVNALRPLIDYKSFFAVLIISTAKKDHKDMSQ